MTVTPDVSVVVPTYNRASRVAGLLAALRQQECAGIALEILVVDNGSTDGTQPVVQCAAAIDPRVRYMLEPLQGASHARNTGIAAATGAIVAFVDDDVVPAADWVRQLKRAFEEHPEVDCIGGRVEPSWPVRIPHWAACGHDAPLALQVNRPAHFDAEHASACLITANFAVRRSVLAEVGGFAPEFQRDEDREFNLRLWRAGKQGLFVDAVRVVARIDPDRLTKQYYRRWYETTATNHARLRYREIVDRNGRLVPPMTDRTMFGVPAFLYKDCALETIRWADRLIRGRSTDAFYHECRVRYFFSYIRTRAVLEDGRIGADRSAAGNLLAGTIAKYVLLGVTLASGIFLMPFTVRHLGKSQYGLWMIVASVTYYFGLLDLGYGNGVVKHIVDADARGDITGVNRVVSTFICVYSVVGAIACVVCAAVVTLALPRFPNLSAADVHTAQVVLAILGARIAIGYPMTVFGAVVNARQGFVLNNTIAIGLVALNALVTYLTLKSGQGLVALVACTTAVNLCGYVAYAWSARRVFPHLRVHVRHFSRTDWHDVSEYSFYLFVIGLGSQISFNLDNLVVGAYLGTAAVAVYAVAARLSEYQRRVCDQFSGMLFPVVLRWDAERNKAALQSTLIDGARVSTLLAAGVTTSLIGYARPLIAHWMGPGFDGTVVSFYVLAIVGVVMVSHAAQASILMATGRHRVVAAVWIVEGLANLVLSLVLVRPFGSVGVATGTLVPMAVGHIGVFTPVACRRCGVPVGQFLRMAFAPALISTIPAVTVCLALRIVQPPATTLATLGEASICTLVFAVTAFLVGLDATTREVYRAQVAAACRGLILKTVFLAP
jgi:O-antigen/teichoic acid export membrane protein/GT2 family glycosyltransferase